MSGLLASAVLAGEAQKSGPIGLATILLLCVACYFLLKSMSKHMRRVRERFPSDETSGPPRRPGQPGGASGSAPGSPSSAAGTEAPPSAGSSPSAEAAPSAVDLGKRPPDSGSR